MTTAIVPAFDDFYRTNYRPLVALAWSKVGNSEDAIDLAQYALTEAYRGWDRIGELDRPDLWVRRVVINRSSNHHRRTSRERSAVSRLRPVVTEDPAPLSDSTHDLLRLIAGLPQQQAAVITLRYLEDLPLDEIADILEVSVGTVKTSLHRARHAIARRLDTESN
jgi:RNA polymerase sigma-70 factor (sigma-E family)